MKRRIYKLKTKFTLLGLEAGDWAILFGTFIFTLNFFQNLGSRLSLLLSLVLTALVYVVWNLVKDHVPENFAKHLFGWLGEPEVYKVVPDTKNIPLVVDFNEVRKGNKRSENAQETWRLPSGSSDSWL
jgi:hypothetical protein